MKSAKSLIIFLVILNSLFYAANKLVAQDSAALHWAYNNALLNTTAVYHHSFGSQGALYNGRQYNEYRMKFKEGDPYFQSFIPAVGKVIYGGVLYDSVLMRYDEVKDELIIHDHLRRIQLLKEKVTSFNLFNNDFINIEKNNLSNKLLSSGFYHLLYKGKICLLKKQVKSLREEISANIELLHFVQERDYYYLKKEDEFFLIKSKGNLIALLEDKKKEVQLFIKTNNLNFKSDRQNMLTKTIAYYDSLK